MTAARQEQANILGRILRRIHRGTRGIPRSPKQAEAAACLLGDLNRWGWANSLGRPPTINHEPVPWITYPAMVWLWGLLSGDERVLELGAGNSTLWFAARATQVISLEHSPDWYAHFAESLPPNVELLFVDGSSTAGYQEDLRLATKRFGPFDIILIDGGPDRVAATIESSSSLQDDGMIILDNSDFSKYQPAVTFLNEVGFHRLDFFGPAPGSRYLLCTSVFSKSFEHWLSRQSGSVLPVPFFENMDYPFRS